MNASHASLRDDFEVTNDALDVMAMLAQATPGCYGARMTGAGLGDAQWRWCGAIRRNHLPQPLRTIRSRYRPAT